MRLLLILLMSITLLQAEHDDDDKKYRAHIPYDMRYLHLDKTQHQQIRTLLSQNRQQLRLIHEEKEMLEKDLKRAFAKAHFDKDAFIQKRMALKERSIQTEAQLLARIHALLTPKQRKAFARYLEEWDDD